MNGTMVRNDITIPLISCQFETSTVFILERLFVFFIIIMGGRAEVKKEAFLLPRVPPRLHLTSAICSFTSDENDISEINAFFFPPKYAYRQANNSVFNHLNELDTKAEADVPNKNISSDAILSIITSKGALSHSVCRQMMQKLDFHYNMPIYIHNTITSGVVFFCACDFIFNSCHRGRDVAWETDWLYHRLWDNTRSEQDRAEVVTASAHAEAFGSRPFVWAAERLGVSWHWCLLPL